MKAWRWAVIGVFAAVACSRGEVIPRETPPPPPRLEEQPTVRVGITLDTTSAMLSSMGDYEIRTQAGDVLVRSQPPENWTFTIEDGRLRAQSSAGRTLGPAAAPLLVTPGDGGLVVISGKNYRGTAFLRITDEGKLNAINVVDIEEYLKGVVPYEIGARPPELIEAVKAQAVAARTYAIGNLNRWGSRGFDFVATVQDQVYGGVEREDSISSRAVLETRGEIVSYEGRPIEAYYSSTCGGRTANAEDSWPWRPGKPYLRSISDSVPGTNRAYCDASNRFRWSAAWTQDSLRSILERSLATRLRRTMSIRRVESVELTGRSPSGRAQAVRLRVDGETHDVPADSIRWVLRPTPNGSLNSALILELKAHEENGVMSRLEVNGAGWGHGIGMCQFGALGRARAGHNYRDILTAYYSGTRVERLY